MLPRVELTSRSIAICQALLQAIRERAAGRTGDRESVTQVFKRISNSVADSTSTSGSPSNAIEYGSYLGPPGPMNSSSWDKSAFQWALPGAGGATPAPAWSAPANGPMDPSLLPSFDAMGLPGIDWTMGMLGSDVFSLDRLDDSAAWLQSTTSNPAGF